jgi:hypothetical protein
MKRTRAALLATLLVAAIYVAGQALAAVPNVEAITFLSFVAGYLLGPLTGALVAGAGMGAHSLFNVMGSVAPPVWIAQIAAYAGVGMMGGLVGPALARMRPLLALPVAGITGALLVLIYQVVINAVSYFVFASGVRVWVYVWGGILFGGVQVLWNAALFLVMPATLRILAPQRREVASS